MDIIELVSLLERTLKLRCTVTDSQEIECTVAKAPNEPSFVLNHSFVVTVEANDNHIQEAPVCITSPRYAEVLLRDVSKRLYNDCEYKVKDDENDLTYELSAPSPRMLVSLLKLADSNENLGKEFRSSFMLLAGRRLSMATGRSTPTIQDPLRYILSRRYVTLKITRGGTSLKDTIDFEPLCLAFCFNLGYNLNRSYLPVKSISELIDDETYRDSRRNQEIGAPKRRYSSDLVHFYLRGNCGESPDYRFLSYYHILEFFFEKVYTDNVVKRIREELTHPSFSYRNEKAILKFLKSIKQTIQDSSSSSGVNEYEALRLTLIRYVPDLARVRDTLKRESPSLVEYLKTNGGPFSKYSINFDIADTSSLYTSLANRIYATRNAVAHSKESISKDKFVPYKQDEALLNEIILIRAISEEVVINSSEILGIK